MNVTSVAATTAFDRWASVPPTQQAAPRTDTYQDTGNGISPAAAAAPSDPRPPAPEGSGKHVDKLA